MARRSFGRRRRPKVAWMPTFGWAPQTEGINDPAPGIEVDIALDGFVGGSDVAWDAFPLTFDTTQDAQAAQADPTKRSLRDIVQGNEWRFRRLVGKAFIHATHVAAGASFLPNIDVALGFIVCQTYDDGSPHTDFSEVNPLAQDSMEDPWIWRRRWILNPWGIYGRVGLENQNALNTAAVTPWHGYPSTNVQYGSVLDGPHIDATSNRIIRRSERLFGVLAARRWADADTVGWVDTEVKMLLDYRVLGSLRGSTYGNRGNMSR